MKTFAWTILAATLTFVALTPQTRAGDKINPACGPLGQYMADMTSPKNSGLAFGGYGGFFGVGSAQIVIMDPGSMAVKTVSPLSDETKASLGSDQKAIQGKYDQIVLANHNLMVEMGKMMEKTPLDGSGAYLSPQYTQKMTALQNELKTRYEAFKRDLFAVGQKKNCIPQYEESIGANLSANLAQQSQSMIKGYNDLLKQKDIRIKGLQDASKKALSRLTSCQRLQTQPGASAKFQKEMDDIQSALDDAEAAPYMTGSAQPF